MGPCLLHKQVFPRREVYAWVGEVTSWVMCVATGHEASGDRVAFNRGALIL